MKKLPIIKVFKDSFLELKDNYFFTLYALIFISLYYIASRVIGMQFKDILGIKISYAIYLIMKYFLIYFLVRRYFNISPLWNTNNFFGTLKQATAIFILYMAFTGAVVVLYKLLSFLALPDFILDNIDMKKYVKTWTYTYYIISIFFIVIPSFAWVSSITGEDNSITSAFFRTSGNYIKIVFLFAILYVGLEFVQFAINELFDVFRYKYGAIVKIPSRITNWLVYIVFFLIKITVFLKIYDFFYNKD